MDTRENREADQAVRDGEEFNQRCKHLFGEAWLEDCVDCGRLGFVYENRGGKMVALCEDHRHFSRCAFWKWASLARADAESHDFEVGSNPHEPCGGCGTCKAADAEQEGVP